MIDNNIISHIQNPTFVGFQATSRNICLVEDHNAHGRTTNYILKAHCKNEKGVFKESILDLNTSFGNDHGNLKATTITETGWQFQNFAASALFLELVTPDGSADRFRPYTQADESDPSRDVYLQASLELGNGLGETRQINLNKHVENYKGSLVNERQAALKKRFEKMAIPLQKSGVRNFSLRHEEGMNGSHFIVVAECQKADGMWQESSCDIGPFVGYTRDVYTSNLAIVWGQGNTKYSKWQSQRPQCRLHVDHAPMDLLKPNLVGEDLEKWKLNLIVDTLDLAGRQQELKLNLTDRLVNIEGTLVAKGIPRYIAIPQENIPFVFESVKKYVEKYPDAEIVYCNVPEDKEGGTIIYVHASASEEGPLVFKTVNVEAVASFQHYHQSKGLNPMRHVDYDALKVEANLTVGFDPTHGNIYFGGGASVDLIKAKASCFELTLGIGVDSGFGIQDWSYTMDILGCGVVIGKHIGVEVFGSSFGINLGTIWEGVAALF